MEIRERRIDDRREEMYKEGVQDTHGWFIESITESDELEKLRDAVVEGDEVLVLDIINRMLLLHIYPSKEEAEEDLFNNGFGRDDL